MDFESTASASSATRARRKSYHKSVLIEGSATSFSSARMVSVNDHGLYFSRTRHAAGVLGGAAATPRVLRAIAQHKAQVAARQH